MTQPHPYSDLPMIVVTGVGRSGTTALRKALGCHPDIISTGHEHNIAFDLLETARRNRTEFSRRVAMQVTDDEHDALFRNILLDLIFPKPEIVIPNRVPMLFTNLFPKTADFLLELIPNAKIVCIVRDGVDTVHSRTKHAHLGVHPFERQCTAWKNAHAMARWSDTTDRCLTIRYEHMKSDPVRTCEQVLAYCSLTPSKSPTNHLLETTHHPTKPEHNASWQSWTAEQRSIFETHCGQEMAELGYTIPWKAQPISNAS